MVAAIRSLEIFSSKPNTMPREDTIADNSSLGISTLFRGLGGLGNVRYDQAYMNAIGALSDRLVKWAGGNLTRELRNRSLSGNTDRLNQYATHNGHR